MDYSHLDINYAVTSFEGVGKIIRFFFLFSCGFIFIMFTSMLNGIESLFCIDT